MGSTVALLAGLVFGLLLAGIGVGLLIPILPEAWRSEPLVWASAVMLVGACVGAAYRFSRPRHR